VDSRSGLAGEGANSPGGGDPEAFDMAEPFEPELVHDEAWGEPELEAEAGADDFGDFDDFGAFGAVGGVGAPGDDALPLDREPVSADELDLYDGVAGEDSGVGVPGPVGLGSEGGTERSGDDTGVVSVEGDEDAAQLLRNAAAAGYTLTDLDLTEEMVLDEEAVEEDRAPDDGDGDGWLPTLLEDER
jgi:hypothetical protein